MHNRKKHLTVAGLLALLLLGCGGGTGSQTDALDPIPDNANATVSLNGVTFSTDNGTTYYTAASRRMAYGARAHLSDVGTVDGFTGEGVWIEIIDDFVSTVDTSIVVPSFQRTRMDVVSGSTSSSSSSTATTCSMRYLWQTKYTHGDLVSSIAGGTTPAQSLSATLSVPTANPACASSFYASNTSAGLKATLDVDPIPGVAPKATVLRSRVDLSTTQDGEQTLASIQEYLRSSMGDLGSPAIGVVNLSLGKEINATGGKTYDEVVATLAQYPITGTVNTVITVAAGNSGGPCDQLNLNGCNHVAVALAIQDATKDSTIVVGALTGPAGAQTMAGYSTRPGFLKNRFIWASGDTDFYPDASGNMAQGTSFAAPRVAGVAALIKQKYPKLTSAEIASAILDTASKDMNNDGKDDFVGVDPIFGRGKLDLRGALGEAARLSSKKP